VRGLVVIIVGLATGCGGAIVVDARGGDDAGTGPVAVDGDAGTPGTGADARDAARDVATDESDASDGFDAAGLDAAQAAPCLAGGDVFYVEGSGGYPGIDGGMSVDGSVGTWSGRVVSETFLQLDVHGHGDWVFAAGGDVQKGIPIGPGSFVSTGDDHGIFAQVGVDGTGCSAVPTGPFTIADFATTGGDQASLTRLLAWFALECPGAGTVRGCVSYGR
jgi:hypothetical protein